MSEGTLELLCPHCAKDFTMDGNTAIKNILTNPDSSSVYYIKEQAEAIKHMRTVLDEAITKHAEISLKEYKLRRDNIKELDGRTVVPLADAEELSKLYNETKAVYKKLMLAADQEIAARAKLFVGIDSKNI